MRAARRWQRLQHGGSRARAKRNAVLSRPARPDGEIWVDDYSLKKIPGCLRTGAFRYSESGIGSLLDKLAAPTVSWNTCCSPEGSCYPAVKNGGAEEVFATGRQASILSMEFSQEFNTNCGFIPTRQVRRQRCQFRRTRKNCHDCSRPESGSRRRRSRANANLVEHIVQR